ncbi:MAG TPA: hypothetical protein VMS17_09380 [Gemmataceae bacterium]|nr:hypothetical protein [Gemmataceae bacterium]
MLKSERLAGFQAARHGFDEALQGMERFLMNLDSGRVQILRDWLRAVASHRPLDQGSRPLVVGWPLAERIDEHMEAVFTARTAVQQAWRLLSPSERDGFGLRPSLR